jgi:GntR family transcriptional regulator/MocR family aminotransferase
MVLPELLVDDFRKIQVRTHKEPSYIIQRALADFIRDGHASSYIRKMRYEYQARRDLLVNLLQKELSGRIEFSGLETGLHLVIYLPKTMNDEAVSAKAKEQGIIVPALSSYYVRAKARRTGLILGFGNVHPKEIKRAAKILCEILKKL